MQSLDDLCDEDDEEGVGDDKGYEEDSEDDHDQEYLGDRKEPERKDVGKNLALNQFW